jgi:septation ring formation regulator EzrA
MKKAIFNAMLKKDFAEKFEKWRETFADYMGDGEMDEGEYASLKSAYEKMTEDALKQREIYAKMLDWEAEDEREASKKGFASMSQDSADELNGRFTAIQGNTYSIMQDIKTLRDINTQARRYLWGIENNTKHCEQLIDINRNIASVKSGIDDINLKGVILKG